jgi:hypothetical protein
LPENAWNNISLSSAHLSENPATLKGRIFNQDFVHGYRRRAAFATCTAIS